MKNLSRRRFIAISGAGIASVPLSSIVTKALADDLPMVDPESAQAKGLQYIAVSATEGKNCTNCILYQGGEDAVGACALFPGSNVAGEAWCVAWAAKA